MPNDAFTIKAIVSELKSLLIGGKISRITQPVKDDVFLTIYNNKQTLSLLLSASPQQPRVHLSTLNLNAPAQAPQFCMVLRKHLLNAIISDIECLPYERSVIITAENYTELKDKCVKKLCLDISGRQSNLILTDENNIIVSPLKSSTLDSNSDRAFMSGLKYFPLYSENKVFIDSAKLPNILKNFIGGNIPEYLTKVITGLSKVSATHITLSALGLYEKSSGLTDEEILNLEKSLKEFDLKFKNNDYNACIIQNEKLEYKEFLPFPYLPYKQENLKYFNSVNECTDQFFYGKAFKQSLSDKAQSATQILKSARQKVSRRIANISIKLDECVNAEINKKYGELITSNIYRIKMGESNCEVNDFYENNELIKIPLKIELSPSANAQRYFKQYAKLKKAKEISETQLKQSQNELLYLESISEFLKNAETAAEIDEILQEIKSSKYLSNYFEKTSQEDKKIKKSPKFTKNGKQTSKPQKQEKAPLFGTTEIGGFKVYYGKNNTQNDYVTFKLAKPNDIWLHVKGYHGAHVIISTENKEVPLSAIEESAKLACKYSGSSSIGGKTEVEYTRRKYIKKPPASPLGFVIYNEYESIVINYNN